MLVSMPAIVKETRDFMRKSLEKTFSFEEGKELQDVVNEVLNDSDLLLFLMTKFPKDSGMELGRMHYLDEVRVNIPYGLTVDSRTYPPKLAIFGYHEVDGKRDDLGFYSSLPLFLSYGNCMNVPTAIQFSNLVNSALIEPPKPTDFTGIEKDPLN